MSRFLIGIDEAGRGPFAGPVSVGVFAVRSRAVLNKFRGVKDSKQLSEKQREEWFKKIKNLAKNGDSNGGGDVFFAVSFSSAGIIDKKGISYAIRSALDRGLKKLEKRYNGAHPHAAHLPENSRVLLDGSLYAPERYKNQKTIIDGDAKEPIIALASICAKVLRDRKIKRMTKKYPKYGLEIHKGYGTKMHCIAIRKHGLSEIHRKTFCKNI